MVARVTSWLALDCEEDGVGALNVALLFKFSQTRNLGVFVVVDMAAREGKFTMEGLLLTGDEHDLKSALSCFGLADYDSVSGCARVLRRALILCILWVCFCHLCVCMSKSSRCDRRVLKVTLTAVNKKCAIKLIPSSLREY